MAVSWPINGGPDPNYLLTRMILQVEMDINIPHLGSLHPGKFTAFEP